MPRPLPQDSPRRTDGGLSDTLRHQTAGTGRPPLLLGSDVFRRTAFGRNHPLAIIRHAAVLDLVRLLGWLDDEAFVACPVATESELTAFHDPAYVAALRKADATGRVDAETRRQFGIGTLENPVFPGLFERAAATVGGSILAARLASSGGVAFHPSGGTHHGRPDRASGFCYFNDPVFAIRTFLELGSARVMYVDLDAHHGDGVQDAFADERRVMTVSIHERDRWPYSGAEGDRGGGGARNLPVPAGFNDSELDYLVQHAIVPLAESFEPEAMVLCCGADCLAGDPLSGMQLSNLALWRAVERLRDFALPTVILGGGGYNPWTVARYWTGLWGRLTKRQFPDRLPAEAVALLGAMDCELIDEDEVDPAWLTTLADIAYPGPVRAAIRSLAAGVRHRPAGRGDIDA
jgi:acetoin utilization protein AcuC